MSHLIRASIDRDALRHNLAAVRRVAPAARVMAVIKANAYGHGLVPTALALADADSLAVARLEEGLQLRGVGIETPIVLLEGVFSAAQLAEAARAQFELVVHDPQQIELLEHQAGSHRFTLWLKIDTGMNRLGFRPEQALAAVARIRTLRMPPREVRFMTHLARADELDSPATYQQAQRFADLMQELGTGTHRPVTSIGNSAGTFGWPVARGDWVRPGLALYGVSPFPGRRGRDLGLVPAMTLVTTVIAIRDVPAGEAVGYGGTWRAPRATRLAILAAGYGDGLPRHLDSGAPILVAGETAPLCGRVSMDMLTVDVTDIAQAGVGSPAVLWGPNLPVEDLALLAGTIPYELLCAVSQRVPLELV